MADTPTDASLVHEFKQSMRRFATTVSIVTAAAEGERFGMVATAVTSVSVDPPAIAVGINRAASIYGPVLATRRFCVNLLRPRHDELVASFSSSAAREERFTRGDWRDDPLGLPYLADAQVSFFCGVDAELTYGSHTLLIGRVERLTIEPRIEPLIWQDGRFAVTRTMEASA